MWSNQILPGESGAVVEGVLIARNPSLIQESTQDFQPTLHCASSAFFSPEQAQQNLRMQVLAYFVDNPDVLDERLGLIAGQD